MKKTVIAISGASGSIYAQTLLKKITALQSQWTELSVVMSDNAKEVWGTELGNDSWKEFSVKQFGTKDFSAPFASGSDNMIP